MSGNTSEYGSNNTTGRINDNLPPAIFLMGPTASGKSHVSLEIARQFPVEIISVDSAQVYRFMNIGTAKPDQETLNSIPHHLINIIDPTESYSAAQFRTDAVNIMLDISSRGKIPLLAGGTMLYFKALLEGLSELPSADNTLRKAIEQEALLLGWPALHAKLNEIDPTTAMRIKQTDSQRIQRALEVCLIAGRPMSEILTPPRNTQLPFQIIQLALLPSDRSQLHRRIASRFENMLNLGLISEAALIRDQFAVTTDMPSMRCVGYRQTWLYLEQVINLQELQNLGTAATRQLAKRQLTWLRSIIQKYEVIEFDCLADNVANQVCSRLRLLGI